MISGTDGNVEAPQDTSIPLGVIGSPENGHIDPYDLDIVKECIALKGAFPENVSFNFVLWKHGANDLEGFEKAKEDAVKLAPYLLRADVVAFEVADSDDSDPIEDLKIFNALNASNERQIDRGKYIGRISTAVDLASFLSMELSERGVTTLPRFTAVDAWAERLPHLDIARDIDLPFRERAERAIDLVRKREVITLHQLHELATSLAVDGAEHEIAVIYGYAHTTLPIATRALGAPTKRVFIDRPVFSPRMIFERKLRFLDEDDRARLDEHAYNSAYLAGIGVALVGVKVGEISEEDWTDYSNVIGNYILRYVKETLPISVWGRLSHNLEVVAPYFPEKKTPPFFKRKGVQKALRNIIDLSAQATRN